MFRKTIKIIEDFFKRERNSENRAAAVWFFFTNGVDRIMRLLDFAEEGKLDFCLFILIKRGKDALYGEGGCAFVSRIKIYAETLMKTLSSCKKTSVEFVFREN